MKSLKLLALLILSSIISQNTFAQNVSINDSGDPADQSAMLDVNSIKKGVLFPRVKSDEMQAIIEPADGLMVYNTELRKVYIYSSGQWQPVSESGYWNEVIG